MSNMSKQWRVQDLTLERRGLCQRGGGGGRKSLKAMKVEVKVIFSVFRPYFCEYSSEEKIVKKYRFGHKKSKVRGR